jgi:hypothetical protein
VGRVVVKVAIAVEATVCFHINTDSATVAYSIQYRLHSVAAINSAKSAAS